MSGKTVVDQIKHYQKDIERCPENSERMIRCIQRLYVLPIQVLHLQETGVGRSVNSLRKYKGEVGEAAKALVAKWKAMVAAEESSDDSNDKHRSQPTDNRINKSNISFVKTETKPEKPNIKVEPKSEKSIVKSEQKTEKQCISNKDKSNSKDRSNSKGKSSYNDKVSSKEKPVPKHHHSTPRHHSESSHSSSKSHSSSIKRSHSGPEKNHTSSSERKKSSHNNHKSSYHDKQDTSDDEGSPPNHKRHKNHHSHSRNHSHPKKEVVESEEEADESNDEGNDTGHSEANDSSSNSENESSGESDNSSIEEEDVEGRAEQREEEDDEGQDSDHSSDDQRHHSKHKSAASHHKHKKSSHLHSDKNKENYNSHKNISRHSSKNSSKESKSTSNNLDELIKENEKKVKKEKDSEFEVPKYIPTKIVKLERNEDGSIDSGSGASFADALLGMDNLSGQKKKNKKPVSSKETSSSNNKSSSSHKSSSSSSSLKRSHNHSSSSSSSTKEKSRERSSSRSIPIDELVETPDLLTKKVKLEALDLDISSTLPEINPNYKPLPHVPELSRRSTKTMSEEDAMFSIMTTKNQRTKVYSGNKVYQDVVPSLFSLCIQLLYENIDAVEYTGGVPYSLLKPLLEKLNSDQLYVIEHFNPYLIEETDNLWKFHCSKDFRTERRQDMESWRDLYLRCLEERERKLKALTANISQSMAKSTPVRQAKLAYVDAVVKPPRNVARKQAKYKTGSGSSSSSNNNKQDILSKAIVGGHTPGVSAKDVVPAPPAPRASSHHTTPAIMKKKKAPLMQKALQFIKGNRYKR